MEENSQWESWGFLGSDEHWDNPHSNHDLMRKHLDQVLERGAWRISAGDALCLMQGKFDKRSNKASLRPEHQVDNYLDAVINTAADFFEPYAKNFVLIATGNHEAAIAERYETNMIDRLVGVLNSRTGSHIGNGGFSGWLILSFRPKNAKGSARSNRIVIHYDHGYGGGGPVTDDMIQHQRRATYLPDADIVLSGHTHGAFIREMARVRLNRDGTIRHDIQTHIKIPSYKDEYREGYGGWATASKGMPPKPQGGWWLRFFWDRSKSRVLYEVIRAQ